MARRAVAFFKLFCFFVWLLDVNHENYFFKSQWLAFGIHEGRV